MKDKSFIGIFIVLFFWGTLSWAQDKQEKKSEKKEIKVKKKTVMEQYEPELILTVDDRIKLKKERIATIEKRREIIDTLSISDRRKRRLLRELYKSPHSYKWEKLIADIEFEDDL